MIHVRLAAKMFREVPYRTSEVNASTAAWYYIKNVEVRNGKILEFAFDGTPSVVKVEAALKIVDWFELPPYVADDRKAVVDYAHAYEKATGRGKDISMSITGTTNVTFNVPASTSNSRIPGPKPDEKLTTPTVAPLTTAQLAALAPPMPAATAATPLLWNWKPEVKWFDSDEFHYDPMFVIKTPSGWLVIDTIDWRDHEPPEHRGVYDCWVVNGEYTLERKTSQMTTVMWSIQVPPDRATDDVDYIDNIAWAQEQYDNERKAKDGSAAHQQRKPDGNKPHDANRKKAGDTPKRAVDLRSLYGRKTFDDSF